MYGILIDANIPLRILYGELCLWIGLKGNPLPTKYINLCNDSNGLQNLLGLLLDSLGGMLFVFMDMLAIDSCHAVCLLEYHSIVHMHIVMCVMGFAVLKCYK